MLEIMKIIDKR